MNQHIDAIFENGVFRPEVPVNIAEGQRVSLNITSRTAPADELADVADLLDNHYTEARRQNLRLAPSLEEVRKVLAAFQGSLSDRICEERDQG